MVSGSARSNSRRGLRSWAMVSVAWVLVAAGCGTVAVDVEQPAGTRVELYQKSKWFYKCGPDWCTGWDRKEPVQTVTGLQPAQLELDADNSWLESTLTVFPAKYRALFDLSGMEVYAKTPAEYVEIRYVTEAIPPKHQDVIRLWHEGRTLDALTHLPVDVLADVLYNLGERFRGLLREVDTAKQEQAAKDFKTLLESSTQPAPKEIESWLKSFLSAEQLGQIVKWVRHGVKLRDVRWVRLGGEPKHKDVPIFWQLLKGFVELFVRQPEIRTTKVNFYSNVILRDLLVTKVESKLISPKALKFYAEVVTYRTTYSSDRTAPALDLVQDVAIATDVVAPNADQEAELQRFGMTRGVRVDQKEQSGLPPAGVKVAQVTSIRSQILGALLDGQVAYLVVWNNPKKTDPVRFLTTVVTTGPYGMARVWAYRGSERLCDATGTFEKADAPIGALVSWIVSVLDPSELFVTSNKPIAVFAFGNRRIAPWSGMASETKEMTPMAAPVPKTPVGESMPPMPAPAK